MNRRELLGTLGTVGVGLTGETEGHEGPKSDKGGMMAPVESLHAHFCGIHIAKKNPRFQLVAQHYCAPLSKEVHQCILFDTFGKAAKLIGIEYIISDRLYRTLPAGEKKYWHPHTYEVLAGGLIAPGMKPEEEMAFMKGLLTTWGKTWHTWPDPTSELPIGEPLLMWALTGDGQEDKAVIAARDRLFGVSTEKTRAQRAKAIGLEVPRVSQPTSIDQPGRQWTDDGEDKPTPRKED